MPEPTTIESIPSVPEGSGSLDRLVRHHASIRGYRQPRRLRTSRCCLALMEIATRTLHAADDAARYARHSMTYPPNG